MVWHCHDAPKPEVLTSERPTAVKDSLEIMHFWLRQVGEPFDLRSWQSRRELIRLTYYGFLIIPTCVILNREGDSVWIETKRVGRFTIPFNGEIRNNHLGPNGRSDLLSFTQYLNIYHWNKTDSLLKQSGFESLSFWDSVSYIDGRSFFLETYRTNQYHSVLKAYPSVSHGELQGDFYRVCLHLIQLTGLKDERDSYPLQ